MTKPPADVRLVAPRPETLLTQAVRSRLLTAARLGNFRAAAAKHAGISPSTLALWIRRGMDEPDSEMAQFRREYLDAEAEAEVLLLAQVKQSAAKDWHAAAWILERRWKDHWAKEPQLSEKEKGFWGNQTVSAIDTTVLVAELARRAVMVSELAPAIDDDELVRIARAEIDVTPQKLPSKTD